MQRGWIPVAIVVVLCFAIRSLGSPEPVTAKRDTLEVSGAQRARGVSFAPSVTPEDRAWILSAIANSRPEARRLIAEVDGLTTFEMTPRIVRGAIGLTRPRPTGDGGLSFVIELDSTLLNGRRVLDRPSTVLHELGHVVDIALVPDRLLDELDAGIPRTGSCGQSVIGVANGACTVPAERLADTFAKWGLRGGVSAVGAGYGIATPVSLEDWGAPLARLADSLP